MNLGFLPPSQQFIMPNTSRLHQLLSRLQPFGQLYDAHQASILTWKNYFQIHDSKLRDCLDTLAVPQLEPYLVWIPFDELEEFEQLAQGGFAKVYKARVWVNPIYHHVAAKEVKMSMAAELVLNVYLSRYGNTTQCAPTMEVFGLSQHQETAEYLMIMQFADLGTLEKYPCDVDGDWYTALTYATKLASRLADLHEIGFTHQDLHPGNVVFHKSRTALLIDVGMSRAAEDSYPEDSIYGRIEYLPPETFEGKDYIQKSDVYCLGTLLWQLIVGIPPQYTASVAVRKNKDGLREELISDAPILFNSIIQSCWHFNPDQRPSARDVYNQLIECAANLAGKSLTSQSNMEDEILGALAIKPTPFSTKTQSFILARRTDYQRKSNSRSSNDDSIYSSTASMSYTGSNFYPRKQLEVIVEQHSRAASVIFGTLRKSKIDMPQVDDDDPPERNVALIELNFRAKNKGVDTLTKVLEYDSAMTNVNLQEKFIDDRATIVLALFLKQNTQLTKLNLSKNNFGLLLTRTLAEFLKQDKTLTELNLGWNAIGDEGTSVLAESLKQNTTLNNLSLGGNGIGDEGVSSLSEALKQNTALVKLNLGDNRIGDNGASAIAKFLELNTRLVELNLSLNCIGDQGFIALAKYIWALEKLNISSNKIGNNGAIAVLEFLRNNDRQLTEMDLDGNGIDDHLTKNIARHNMRETEWDQQSFITIATKTSISTTETHAQYYNSSRSIIRRIFPIRLPQRNKLSPIEKQYQHLDRLLNVKPQEELKVERLGLGDKSLVGTGQNLLGHSPPGDFLITGAGQKSLRGDKLKDFFGVDSVQDGGLVKTPARDVMPWYLGYDYNRSEMVLNMEGYVKGGTLSALVERLTLHDYLDSNFIGTFLLTYRSFCTTEQFFDLLVKRYTMEPPEGLTREETEIWEEKKRKIVRLRVSNILKNWVENYYNEDDSKVLSDVREFADTVMREAFPIMAIQLVKLIDKHTTIKLVPNTHASALPPTLPKNIKRFRFLDLDPLELARQLTIMDSRLYIKIKPLECLDKTWSREDAENEAVNVKACIEYHNQMTAWVSDSILSQLGVKKRTEIIKHWVQVAEECRILNNYNTCMAILASLDSSAVGRLKRTWEMVTLRTMQTLAYIRRMMSANKNFTEYREIIRHIHPPCIPFLGIYLWDLAKIEEYNSDFLEKSETLINFSKREMTSEILRDIQLYQSTSYLLQPLPEIQYFIKVHLTSSRDDVRLYELSLELESRTREDENIARLLFDSGFL